MSRKAIIAWDLSDLYASITDPRIATDIAALEKGATRFKVTYQGKLTEPLTAKALKKVLDEYSALVQGVRKLESYASLEHSTHVNVEAYETFFQRIATVATEIFSNLVFFEVELISLSDVALQSFIADARLAAYRHYLRKKLQQKKHYLSEEAERVVQHKSLTGRQAFVRLHTKKRVQQQVPFTERGKAKKDVSVDYLIHLLRDPRREVRKRASVAIGVAGKEIGEESAFIYNALMQDFGIDARLRHFPAPEDMRHLENEVERSAVDVLVEVVRDNYDIVQKYYRFKKKVMRVGILYDYDKYAPVFPRPKLYSLPEAQRIIQASFQGFSSFFAETAELFFENKWVDVSPREHKHSGAYCAYTIPDVHPYVFVNYHGNLNDVSTLAHELGHGIQAYAARHQNVLQYDWPLPIAETASVFAEMIVFKELLRRETDERMRLALYMWKLEGIFATVFRQISMYQFERAAHSARQEKGEIGVRELDKLWLHEQQAVFGNSMKLTPGQETFWGLVPHFFHTPFYVYAYAFGQLLTLSLFALYEKSPQDFVKKYETFMSQSGGKSPQELMYIFGVDIDDPAFWEQGIAEIRSLFDQAKQLA